LLLARLPLESLPNSSSCSISSGVSDSFVTEYICGELCLSFADAGSRSSVIAMDLRQHEEVTKGTDDPANSDEENDEANEVISTTGACVSSASSSERGYCDNQSTSAHLLNSKRHKY